MNIKAFVGDALASAIEQRIGTADDLLRFVTPEVLAQYLPRPLWARLLTACLGAPKVDAQLVVETVGIPNLCEHVPATILWACIADLAGRSLGSQLPAVPRPGATPPGGVPITASRTGSARVGLAPAPPEAARPKPAPAATGPAGPSIPPVSGDIDTDEPKPVAGARAPAPQRFRQASTGIGRLGAGQARRPQAQATPAATASPVAANTVRRGATATDVSGPEVDSEWRGKELAVDDSQLVDWSTETTEARDDDFSDLGRKR